MFVGKWNPSVILTYFGVLVALMGMILGMDGKISAAFCCLLISGVCDLFDGKVARMCKRTKEEEAFGVQLDSLADMIDFVAFPIVLSVCMGANAWYDLLIYGIYAVCGIARLAHFNVQMEGANLKTPIAYYSGLPVTYIAMILPLFEIGRGILLKDVVAVPYMLVMAVVAFLYIFNIKIKKPGGIAYGMFALGALASILVFIFLR